MSATFSAPTRQWFEGAFDAPTAVQTEGWAAIATRAHTLLLAPTGSGKTLAAFLWAIDQTAQLPADADPGVRVLYISPLKALAYDVERNLRAPLVGVQRTAELLGDHLHPIRISTRTGDTPQRERRQFLRSPGEILITTPESLFLLLGSQARECLRTVQTVIIDEIHTFAGGKRGVHLALSMERLSAMLEQEPQRIGLSATIRPIERIAQFLGGRDREVQVVDTSAPPNIDLQVMVPVDDMSTPVEEPAPNLLGEAPRKKLPSIWPAIHPKLLELIEAHQTTIIFTNSRLLCERLAGKLNELAGDELVRAHHGSIAHEHRQQIEEQLKGGELKGIVATSSLELGIDMGTVDLVIQVESPGSVARGLQRVGRAGHGVGQKSIGRLFPKYRGDLLEAAVVCNEMVRGHIEEIHTPNNCLDVLAQHIVSMCAEHSWPLEELEALVRRAHPYRQLSRDALVSVLEMLSGRYPASLQADLRPRLVWDRETDQLRARKGAGQIALTNAGTIPDRGLYGVHVVPDGPRVGELDEEMVFETRKGDNIILGASTWRVQEITRDRVEVSPAPGEPGRLPFWRGDGPGRPLELGRAVGAFTRLVSQKNHDDAKAWLGEHSALDERAINNVLAYIEEQREATGLVPTDRTIVVERFRDELGDWRICLLSPFGGRVHAPWALALEAILTQREGFEVQVVSTDDGLVARFADSELEATTDLFFPDPDEVEDLIVEALRTSAMFASRFREAAARALLLPRRRPGSRTPLWSQRRRAEKLLAAVGGYASFPIVLEAYRECLQDVFDVPALATVLRNVQMGQVRVEDVETRGPSPFAQSLVFAYVANFLYEGDSVPLAERRALALTLDRGLLRDLLGQEELRSLLDAEVIAEVEAELSGRDPERQLRSGDDVLDLLRRIGATPIEELQACCDAPIDDWLTALRDERQVSVMRIAGAEQWVANDHVALYRDGLGAMPPRGVPAAFLEPAQDALTQLVQLYARCHGPFVSQSVADALGLTPSQVEPVLRQLTMSGELDRGEMRPGGVGMEWCNTDVLRRIRRRTLARLRGEVAAVDTEVLGRFLPDWHGLGERQKGVRRLREVVGQLEGLAIPWSDLETTVLPARVRDYQPRFLDELGAHGEVMWVGCGKLGTRDGKVMLLRRERLPLLWSTPTLEDLDEVESRLLEEFEEKGALFEFEATQVLAEVPTEEVRAALWGLVWRGVLTNDTFAPLRSLSARRTARNRHRSPAGRWSLIRPFTEANPTQRAHARAMMLLDRYGVVSRAVLSHEDLEGGFSAVYPVLRAMEESGKVRRGHFVAGMAGAQFALPGVVDRLRAHRDTGMVRVVAATDPANPYGTILSWPEVEGGTPKRVRGAVVVLVDGRMGAWFDPGGRKLVLFPGPDPHQMVTILKEHFRGGKKVVRIDKVNGVVARDSSASSVLGQAGCVLTPRGFVLV